MNSALELETVKKELELERSKSKVLTKAIWDMLNYTDFFVLLLDSTLTIKLINWSLAIRLGFENEKEPIGKNWFDFIPEKEREYILKCHKNLTIKKNNDFKEVVNSIVTKKGELIKVKWFNIPINSSYNMVFSIGLERVNEITEDSIRAYYRDIIDRDKTMIQVLRDSVIGG